MKNIDTVSTTALGFPIPAVGLMNLAQWQLSREATGAWIERCLDLGVTVFDHADIYGGYTCEALFGAALAAKPSLRQRMRIVSKCGIKLVSPNRPAHHIKHYDSSRAHIIAAVDSSLRALATDHIDVLLIHRPDPLMDADETAAALAALREAGKVLHVGVSNFKSSQIDLLASRLEFPLIANQIRFSALAVDALFDGTLDQCQRLGMAPMAWSPLGGGSMLHDPSDRAVRLRAALEGVGRELGDASVDQVALAWIIAHPARIVPVLGTGNLQRIESAVRAAALQLDRQQWYRILAASMGHDVA